MLIECLVYVLVAFILSGVAYVAFYQCMDNSLALRRSTDDISNALRAGERWRADVRSSGGRIRTENVEGAQVFVVPSATGDVAYQFSTNGVSRRVGSGAWVCLLEKVNSSTMQADVRGSIEAWRWELELKPRFKKQGRLRPLFTFTAVPERSPVK
jgi:hypothetical protein